MEKLRWVLAGVVGLGLFSAGYLVRGSDVEKDAGGSENSTRTAHRPNRQDSPESLPERKRAKAAQKPADGQQASYRKIVDMVSKGKLRIDGVQIDSQSFLPGDQVGEFFGLSDEQLNEMKRLGFERLRERENREQSLAKIHEVSEAGMVFDLPADSEFATTEAARFVEDLSLAFGPDVAAMLHPSVSDAYGDFGFSRHVRYSLTRRDDMGDLPANAPKELRAMHEAMYDFKIQTNQNEDGSYMEDDKGHFLRGGGSSTGILYLNDPKPESYRPRYHYLWEREMKRR
jgi:hypothetical protein